MSYQCQHLMSLICLLAYLVASAPGYVTSAFFLAGDSACCAGAAECTSTGCCSAKKQVEQELCSVGTCECVCVGSAVRPNGTVVAASCGHHHEPGAPCDSACPDGCLLCNAVGSVPSVWTPPVVLQGGVWLGTVDLPARVQLEQPDLCNLIRPPIC